MTLPPLYVIIPKQLHESAKDSIIFGETQENLPQSTKNPGLRDSAKTLSEEAQ